MISVPTGLIEEIPCCVMLFADDGCIAYANRRSYELLGYQSGELVGRHVNGILPVAGRMFLQTHFCPLLRTNGVAEEIYLSVQGKDGAPHPVLVNGKRRIDHSGPITICTAISIETRNQYEDEIIQVRNKLVETNAKLMESLEQIRKISALDELTDIPNRRSLMARLEQERMRTERTGVAFSVALIDLDHFKQINDTYGHHVGDEVLKLFAKRGSHSMRAVDVFGRYGGEEFLAVMTGTEGNAATMTVRRVLAVAAAGSYSEIANGLAVSASAGVAAHVREESIHQLLGRSDAALYEAKSRGRNQVVQASHFDQKVR